MDGKHTPDLTHRACGPLHTPFTTGLGTHLELVHDFADSFATGTNDTGMNTVVQWDILRNHLLELTHNFQYSIPSSFGILFIPCDGNLVLGLRRENPVRNGGALGTPGPRHRPSRTRFQGDKEAQVLGRSDRSLREGGRPHLTREEKSNG